MVEGARLESVYTSKGYREFESLTLRKFLKRQIWRFFVFWILYKVDNSTKVNK